MPAVSSAGAAVEMYTRSPQTTGDPAPRPGTSIFQRTFVVSLQSAGGVAVADTPVFNGPRQFGQNPSGAAAVSGRHSVASASAQSSSRRVNTGEFLRA
jgi:hypothetical protein